MEVPKSLDYAKKSKRCATLRLSKLVPQSGSQSATIGTATSQSVFELPLTVPAVLSESCLTFTTTFTAAGASKFNWMFADNCAMIDSIRLVLRNGLELASIQNVGNYLVPVSRAFMTPEELGQKPYTTIVSAATRMTENCQPTNVLGNAAQVQAVSGIGQDLQKSNTAMRNLIAGATNAAQPVIRWKISMDAFKNTLLAYPKHLLFNDIANLTITWATRDRVGCFSASATDPSSTPGALAENVAVSDISFYLAQDRDREVYEALRQQLNGAGLSIPVDFVYYNKQGLSGTSQNITTRYDRSNGRRLKYIIHSVFNGTETSNTAYDNYVGDKITNFYTSVNNERLQDENVDIASFQDGIYQRNVLQGSIAGQNEYDHHSRWFWVDSFVGDDHPTAMKDFNSECGLPLDNPVKWSWTSTTANASHNHYTYAIVQRLLTIRSNEVILD